MRFSGKTVYVTQANTAQGEALALRFASEGANLVLGSGTEELLGKIEAKGAKGMIVTPDILTYEGAEALVDEVKAKLDASNADLSFIDVLTAEEGLAIAENYMNEFKDYFK